MEDNSITMYGCIDILDTAVNMGLIQKDPNNSNNILIYYSASADGSFKKGRYSRNLINTAEELLHDKGGQDILLKAIKEKLPEYTVPSPPCFDFSPKKDFDKQTNEIELD